MASSEGEVYTELNDARIVEHRRDLTEGGRVDILVARVERGVVERVDRVHGELDFLVLGDRDALVQAQVRGERPRPVEVTALQHAEGAGAGIEEDLSLKGRV